MRSRHIAIAVALGLLATSTLVLGPGPSLGAVPSPTPRPSSAGGTPTASPTQTPPCDIPTPVPQAAPSEVRSGQLVTLDGSASRGAISGARWAQIAGPRVTIDHRDSLTASFVAPPVAVPTAVTMALVVFSPCTPSIVVGNVDVTILPPVDGALIAVEADSVVVGEPATINVQLHSDRPVASVAHDLTLGPALSFVAMRDGRPECAVPAELGATAAEFEFTPPACVADACTGIHVAISNPQGIPDGALLYSCTVAAGGNSPTSCDYPYDCCDHRLACDDPTAAALDGAPVPTQCVEGAVQIQYPQPMADFLFSIDPPEPRVGDLVQVTVEIVRRGSGLLGLPFYNLDGTQPYLIGDISPQHVPGSTQVTYELQAAQAGTAELSFGVAFETQRGCPGNDSYEFDGLGSEIFPLTIAARGCTGDCDTDGRVAIHELTTGVRMALGDAGLTACPAMDGNGRGGVQVDDLVAAVTASLHGCTD